MKFRHFGFCVLAAVLLSLTFFLAPLAIAQAGSGTLRGRVTDPTGAVIPQATVIATGARQTGTAVSDAQGAFEIKGLAPGTYAVSAQATGFARPANQNVTVSAGQVQ